MLIIDHTKPPTPILEHKPTPSFRSELEKQRYWGREKIKWIEGVGDIPGTLYFKTQELQIKDRLLGHTFRPICRDVDLLIHQTIRDCIRVGEADVLIKGRGLGLSTEFGCLANYFMRVHPGTTSFLTSKDKTSVASLFAEKVAVAYDNMADEIKPEQHRRNQTSNNAYLETKQYYLNDKKEKVFGISKILCKETSESVKSASAFSGEGAIFGGYDELYLHKRRKELVRSSTSCYVDPKTKKVRGFLFAGGTCEDTLTNDELAALAELIKEVQSSNRLETMRARLTFIPSWMGMFMENGWSNEAKAREWWNKEVEELDKLKDTKALRSFRMNNPMVLDDIFELNKGGRFEDDVADMVKAQYTYIISNPQPEKKCKLVDMGGNVTQQLDKAGSITILEDPRESVDYFLNVDGVATGTEVGGDEGSNVAGTITKMYDSNGLVYAPVCIFSQRPKRIEDAYYALMAQAKYYNQFGGFRGIMAEANASNADHFATFLTKNGLEKWIMGTQDLSGKGNSNTKKSFQYIGTPARSFQYRQANMFLRKHISNIRMIELLQDMMKPGSENADILDSWLMFFIGGGRDWDKPIEKKVQIKAPRQVMEMIRISGDRTKLVWKTIP